MARIKFVKRTGKKQLRGKWRRPKGRHNKQRLRRKGRPISPSVGYGKIGKRGKGRDERVMGICYAENLNDLRGLKEGGVCILASNVGVKKRLSIVKVAKEKGIKIMNIKDLDEFIKVKTKVKKVKKEEKRKEEGKEKKGEVKDGEKIEEREEKGKKVEKKEAEKKEEPEKKVGEEWEKSDGKKKEKMEEHRKHREKFPKRHEGRRG